MNLLMSFILKLLDVLFKTQKQAMDIIECTEPTLQQLKDTVFNSKSWNSAFFKKYFDRGLDPCTPSPYK